MTSELKPCPFCGGKVDPEGWISFYGKGPECEDCGATAQSLMEWNTRAVPDVPELVRLSVTALWGETISNVGEYVRYDQAAAMLAAADMEIERLQELVTSSEQERYKKTFELQQRVELTGTTINTQFMVKA